MDAKLNNVASQRDDFHINRSSSWGGSELAPLLIGYDPGNCSYNSAQEIIEDKRGVRKRTVTPNKAMILGTYTEPGVIEIFEMEDGRKVEQLPMMIKHQDYPHSHANVDGVIVKDMNGQKVITHVFEAKTSGFEKEELPDAYELQVRHYMAVLSRFDEIECDGIIYKVDLEGAVVFMVILGTPGYPTSTFEVPYSPEDATDILEYEEYAWNTFVVDGINPLPTGKKEDTALLAEHIDPSQLEEDRPDLKQNIDLYCMLKEQQHELDAKLKDLTQQLDMVKQMIISSMNSQKATCDKYSVSVKLTYQKRFRKKALLEDHPELKELLDGNIYKLPSETPTVYFQVKGENKKW